MKYPAILKNTIGGQTVLAVSGKLFIHMSGEFEVEDSESYSFDSRYKNITAEYLANTYGEVKSKEHAEFIAKLAENHRAICPTDINYNKCKFFYFSSTGDLFFTKEKVSDLATDYKKITIPLPPECESVDEWPKVNDDVFYNGQKWTFVAKHNDMAMLFWTGDEYCTAKISDLQKPKTPEQELCDELYLLLINHCYSSHKASSAVDDLLSKYNITKKPQ